MGLFSRKKKETTDEKKEAKETKPVEIVEEKKEKKSKTEKKDAKVEHSLILRGPRMTEKAAALSEHRAYTFNVPKDATKSDVKRAIKEMYQVTPTRINILPIPRRRVFSRKGRMGYARGGKKAVVYLPKGKTIEFV